MKTLQFVEAADAQTKLDVLVEIGSVTIRPSTSQEIIVNATYRHMDVWVERREDTVMVRAEQEDEFFLKLGRLFNNDHPKAELIIELPAHCEIHAKTITGRLDVAGIDAPVTSRVTTGQLTLNEIHGPIYAKTITGKLVYKGALSQENHRFETMTGEIVLALPENTDAKLSAQAATGKTGIIATDMTYHGNTALVSQLSTRKPPIGGFAAARSRGPRIRQPRPVRRGAGLNQLARTMVQRGLVSLTISSHRWASSSPRPERRTNRSISRSAASRANARIAGTASGTARSGEYVT